MRLSLVIAAVSSAALAASFAGTATAQPPEPESAGHGGAAAGNWIVVLEDDASPAHVARAHSRRYDARVGHVYRHALRGYAARMSDTAAARVADDPRVTSVQPDGVVSIAAPGGKAKPDNGNGGGKPPKDEPPTSPGPAQTVPTGISRVNADSATVAAIDVAVIDTGVDLDHPDLDVVGGTNCSTGKSHDDGNGHGTHVAGTIGALDNEHGVVGVAPGARIWAVRVLDNRGSGTWSSVICGVDWVAGNSDIDVANMSLGGNGADDQCGAATTSSLHEAICGSVAAGVTYVVAAGNSSLDAAGSVPATYDEVITVSALADFDGQAGGLAEPTCRTDEDDTFANFSNFGADVDLIAPGVCIESTWKGGGYNTISGTSMAAPHVAGGAALFIAGGGLTGVAAGDRAATVRSALRSTGSTASWDGTDDGDDIKEPLLDVATY